MASKRKSKLMLILIKLSSLIGSKFTWNDLIKSILFLAMEDYSSSSIQFDALRELIINESLNLGKQLVLHKAPVYTCCVKYSCNQEVDRL